MSPGVPSRVAELGGDPHRLAEAFHRTLVKAEKVVERDASSVASLAAVMQAIAIQTLASNVGRLVEAIEADNATGHLVFPSALSGSDDAR